MDTTKNRQRDPYTFANINLLGRCNWTMKTTATTAASPATYILWVCGQP